VKYRQPAPPDVFPDSSEKNKKPAAIDLPAEKPVEIGGPKGPEPTRYGDWESAGRCSDF